jgi:hypothetical protein
MSDNAFRQICPGHDGGRNLRANDIQKGSVANHIYARVGCRPNQACTVGTILLIL